MYFVGIPERFIYKIRTDGTQLTQLTGRPTEFFMVYSSNKLGDKIYYTEWDSKDLYRIRFDGTHKERVSY